MKAPRSRRLLSFGRPQRVICTTYFDISKILYRAHIVYLLYVFHLILTKTRIMSLKVINSLIFVTETKCAFCEVGLQLIMRPNLSKWHEETHFTGGINVPWDVTPISLVGQVNLKMETVHISERLVKPTKLHSYIHGCKQGMQTWHVTPWIKKKKKETYQN